MKFIPILIGVCILVAAIFLFVNADNTKPTRSTQSPSTSTTPTGRSSTTTEAVTVIAENLDTPWAIAFLPDGRMLVTERPGTVRLINADGTLNETPAVEIASVQEVSEGGLLGITTHPNFAENNYVYLYYTYSGSGNRTLNRVVRMTFANNRLSSEQVILDAIPGAPNHDGGRIKFGPDGMLYIGTGDAQEPSEAQNTRSLAGKILRVTDEGKPASGNPYRNEVYSYGHRNVQGLAWNENGDLWATEHGRSGVASGLDELNHIRSGVNYGWPEIEGTETRLGMVSPKQNSGPLSTWAPSGAAFIGDSLFFSGLRGRTLYEAEIRDGNVTEVREHFANEYGRIREVIRGPDGLLYITTSNTDGRGTPSASDDRIIRINPTQL